MSANEAMIVRDADVRALVGSKYYKPRKNGIEFATDDKGELLPVPKEEIYGLIGSLDVYNQAFSWWVGDTGNAVQKLFGDDELAAFFQKIHFDPGQGKKWMSVSRSFGWPNKIGEMRHSDPAVSHRHHQLVAGIKDAKQRMNLLNTASKKKMTSADFYEFVERFKAGPGAPGGDGGVPEYSVFHIKFRAYDSKTDSPEQYLQELIEHVKTLDFPAYLDPKVAEAQKATAAREKAVEGVAEPRRSEILNDTSLDLDAVKKAVKVEKDKGNVGEKIATFAKSAITDKVIADATERQTQIDAMVAQAATEGDDLAAFKARVKNFKSQQKKREGEVKTIEKMAEKLKDETKRQELIDRAHAENMTVEAFEPIIKQALTDQFVQEESDRIKAENEANLTAAADPTKAAERVEKMFAKKAAKPKADDSGFALKKGAGKKKAAKRKK